MLGLRNLNDEKLLFYPIYKIKEGHQKAYQEARNAL